MVDLISYSCDQGNPSIYLHWFSVSLRIHAKNEKKTLF